MDKSAEHPGQPQRPPASAHLLIDSLDRYADTGDDVLGRNPGANDFTISRTPNLLNGYFTRVAITQIFFEFRIPTIVSGVNDKVLFYNTTTGVSGELVYATTGYYTPDTLAASLQAALQSGAGAAVGAGATWTATYNDVLGCIEVASNNGDNFYFPYPGTNWTQPLTTLTLQNVVSSYRTLGLIVSKSNASASPTQNNNRTPNLLYTPYCDIISDRLTRYQRVKDNNTHDPTQSPVIARVYFQAPNTQGEILGADALGSAPFNICIDYNTPKHIKWSPDEAIHQLDFRVLDQYGNLLYWDATEANWNYNLTILASET